MKKNLLIFVLTILFVGCSRNDDNNAGNQKSIINPPNWIKGSWTSDGQTITFTNDDIIVTQGGMSTYYKSLVTPPASLPYSQTSSENHFTCIFGSSATTQSITWKFTKKSSTKMIFNTGTCSRFCPEYTKE